MARRLSLLHPFLVALFPVLSLAAHNASTVSMAQVWPTAALSLLGAALLWCVFRPLLGDWPRAGVMTSIALVLFFSYGQLHRSSGELSFLRNRYLLPAAAGVLALTFWRLRRLRREPAALAKGLALVAAFLVAVSLARIAIAWRGSESGAESMARGARTPPADVSAAAAALPDVYYVILDGYASARTLREIYGYDNREFLAGLAARGFYVAGQSHSNYAMTPVSLASSTNMDYISPSLESLGRRTKDLKPLYRLIEDGRVMRRLKDRGYKFVNFQSGWTVTAKNRNADWDVNCGGWKEFNRVLAQTTLLEVFGFGPIGEQSRKRVLCTFATLAEVQHRIAGPRFVFAHIVSPEPPLLFGRNGEKTGLKSSEDAYKQWKYKSRYVDQVVFLNQKVIATLDRILAEAPQPPVIVLQSDHGSASSAYDWMYSDEGPPATGNEPGIDVFLRERMEILNAYRLPGGTGALYPSISPVNSFRVVLDAILGEHYPLLEDRSYFSRYAHPYQFVDVTRRVLGPPSGPASP